MGVLAFQIPADNTFALFAAPRLPYGGYGFPATRGRARQAVTDAIVGTLGVAEQFLTGVRTIISSGLVGITYFAQTLVAGGDVIAAIQAGLAPVSASVQTALGNTIGAIEILREAVYTDLTSGPGPSVFPIPTVSAPASAAATAQATAVVSEPASALAGAARNANRRTTTVAAPSAAVAATSSAPDADQSNQPATTTKDTGSHRTRQAETRSTG